MSQTVYLLGYELKGRDSKCGTSQEFLLFSRSFRAALRHIYCIPGIFTVDKTYHLLAFVSVINTAPNCRHIWRGP
jgi:hypothetical protein